MALEKCSNLQRPGILLDLATSFSKQGEYSQALEFFNRAIAESKKLTIKKSISEEDKRNQIRINGESWSRLGVLYESINDFDGALKAYDTALNIINKQEFVWEKYKTLSRKVKLFIKRNEFEEAEKILSEAQKLHSLTHYDDRAGIYIAHDRANLYRAKSLYVDALNQYSKIVYGNSQSIKVRNDHLLTLMKEQADLFGEVMSGIHDCLVKLGKDRLAEEFYSGIRAYEDVRRDAGIYKEMDKQAKLEITYQKIADSLMETFGAQPNLIQYRNMTVEYDPDKGKAIVKKDSNKIILNKRAFLILKCLYDNKGKCVARTELENVWEQHGEGFYSKDSIKVYVNREIRKKLGLTKYVETCSKPSGWKLIS